MKNKPLLVLSVLGVLLTGCGSPSVNLPQYPQTSNTFTDTVIAENVVAYEWLQDGRHIAALFSSDMFDCRYAVIDIETGTIEEAIIPDEIRTATTFEIDGLFSPNDTTFTCTADIIDSNGEYIFMRDQSSDAVYIDTFFYTDNGRYTKPHYLLEFSGPQLLQALPVQDAKYYYDYISDSNVKATDKEYEAYQADIYKAAQGIERIHFNKMLSYDRITTATGETIVFAIDDPEEALAKTPTTEIQRYENPSVQYSGEYITISDETYYQTTIQDGPVFLDKLTKGGNLFSLSVVNDERLYIRRDDTSITFRYPEGFTTVLPHSNSLRYTDKVIQVINGEMHVLQ